MSYKDKYRDPEYHKNWRKKNLARIKQHEKDYYRKNRKKIIERQTEYWKNHPEQRKENISKYRRLNRRRFDSLETWPFECCKLCGNRNVIGFSVADDIWKLVTGNYSDSVLCPGCFDRMAQSKKVRYKFLKLFPVTWQDI